MDRFFLNAPVKPNSNLFSFTLRARIFKYRRNSRRISYNRLPITGGYSWIPFFPSKNYR